MRINCQEYRISMELLSLKRKLDGGVSNPDELKALKERIKIIEKELKID